MGRLSPEQIAELGLAAVGDDVVISDRCSIYGSHAIAIGNRVRIDDFAVITASREPVVIGSHVHISAFSFLSGPFGIVIEDFVNVSVRASLLSGNDDFTGHWLPGSLAPEEVRHVQGGRIHLCRHTIVGAHSVVLPGVTFHEGAAVGAVSLVKESLAEWGIYAGIPARLLRQRDRRVAGLAAELAEAPRQRSPR